MNHLKCKYCGCIFDAELKHCPDCGTKVRAAWWPNNIIPVAGSQNSCHRLQFPRKRYHLFYSGFRANSLFIGFSGRRRLFYFRRAVSAHPYSGKRSRFWKSRGSFISGITRNTRNWLGFHRCRRASGWNLIFHKIYGISLSFILWCSFLSLGFLTL